MFELKFCPKCGNLSAYNSWFGSFYCNKCGNLFEKKEDNDMDEKQIWWMNNDELKTCPFCGGQAYLKDYDYGDLGKSFYVFCSECYTETFEYPNVHEAVEAWNRRVQQENYRVPSKEEYREMYCTKKQLKGYEKRDGGNDG